MAIHEMQIAQDNIHSGHFSRCFMQIYSALCETFFYFTSLQIYEFVLMSIMGRLCLI